MNPETPFIETPPISLALQNNQPSEGIFVTKLDLYNPTAYQTQAPVLASQNTGELYQNEDKNALDIKLDEILKKPYNVNAVINTPKETPLSQTLRYNNNELGGFRYDDPTQEFRYGNNQSFLNSVGTRAMQFAGNFGTSFFGSLAEIPTVIGSTYNFLSDVAQGKDKTEAAIDAYRGLFNNPVSDSLEELNKSILDANITYDTRRSAVHPLLSSKIFGDIFASSGFALGSMLGMFVEDAVVGAATGGTALAPLLAAQLGKTGYKAIKLLHSGDNAVNTLKGALNAGKRASVALDGAYAASKLQKGFFGLNLLTNSIYESGVEAKQTQEATEQSLINQHIRQYGKEPTVDELSVIKSAANEAANWTFFGNSLLLAATNKFEFGDIIKRMQIGKEAFDLTEKGLVRLGLGEGIDDIKILTKAAKEATVPTSKLGRMWAGMGKLGNEYTGYIRSAVGEGIEEGGQFSIASGVEDYYKLKYNKDSIQSSNNLLNSVGNALGKTLTSEEGWSNIIAGIGGGIVMGSIRKLAKLDPKSLEVDRDALVSNLTSVKLSDILSGMGTKLDQHVKASTIFGLNSKVKDWYSHQTNQHAQVFNWTLSALKGRNNYFDIRVDQIKTAKELEDEEFTSIFGLPYNDTTKKLIHSYLDSILEDAQSIKKNYERVNSVYKNPYGFINDPKKEDLLNYNQYEDYKSELIFHLSKQQKNEKESGTLTNLIQGIDFNLTSESILNLSTKNGLTLTDKGFQFNIGSTAFINKEAKHEGIEATKAELLTEQKRLTDLIQAGIATDADKQAKRKLDKLVNQSETLLTDWDSSTHSEFVKDYLNYTFDKQNNPKRLTYTDVDQLLSYGIEQAKLKASTLRSLELFEKLSSKKGFEQFKQQETETTKKWLSELQLDDEDTSDNIEEDDITDEDFEVFKQTNDLPGIVAIIDKIARKIIANEALTEKEKVIYAFPAYKTRINDRINELRAENQSEPVSPVPTNPPESPKQDEYTGFKEGDIIKGTQSTTEFTIQKIEPSYFVLRSQDGKTIKWTKPHMYLMWDTGQYTVTGKNQDYTLEDVKKLHYAYDSEFLFNFGLNHGGAKYAFTGIDADVYKRLTVFPSDVGKPDKNGDRIKPILFTRKGINALLDYYKNPKPDPDVQEANTKAYIYAGRERTEKDKENRPSVMAMLEDQYGIGPEETTMSLTSALRNVINSEYATAPEQELARYMLPFINPDDTIEITPDQTYYDHKTGIIKIGLVDLEDSNESKGSPIEVIIVHETLHKLTVGALKTDKTFFDEITALQTQAKAVLPKATYRGLEDNVAEFITEALTNQEFMKALASIPHKSVRNETLWDRFIKAVRQLLGVTKDTMLEYITDLVFSEIENVNMRNVLDTDVAGMKFNPAVIFTKLTNRSNDALMQLRNQGNLSSEYLVSNGEFRLDITRDTTGIPTQLTQDFTQFSRKNEKGEIIKHPKLFKKHPDRVIELVVNGQLIGRLQPISTWRFRSEKSDNLLPLTELTIDEYTDVTGNPGVTYNQFMQTIQSYSRLEEFLLKKENGETIKLSTLKSDISFTVNIGKWLTIDTEKSRPKFSELSGNFPTFNGKPEPFILSLSDAFNPKTQTWEPNPVGYLTGIPEGTIVRNLIENYIKNQGGEAELRKLNARYIGVVSLTGKWDTMDDIEFVVTHPNVLIPLDQVLSITREALEKSRQDKSVVPITGFYITDATKSKRELSFIAKDGVLLFTSRNPGSAKIDYSESISMDITKPDEFLVSINKALVNRGIPSIVERDFRVDIEEDASVDPSQLQGQLTSVVHPFIRDTWISITSNLLSPISTRVTDALTTIPANETTNETNTNKPVTDDDLANFFNSEGEEVELPENLPVITNKTPVLSQADAKSAALKNNKMGKGFKKYQLMTPSIALLNQYKRVCGS